MIKAAGKDEHGNPVIILGLSESNIAKLKRGEPILIDNHELGLEGQTVIMYGKTEDDITAELAKHFRLPS